MTNAPHPASPQAVTGQNRRLNDWLSTARDLLWELHNRRRILERLHPGKNILPRDAENLEGELDQSEAEITALCEKIETTERATPPLGLNALLKANNSPTQSCDSQSQFPENNNGNTTQGVNCRPDETKIPVKLNPECGKTDGENSGSISLDNEVFLCAAVVLVMSRLSAAFDGKCETVGALCCLAGGDCPASALALRRACSEGGIFSSHLNIRKRKGTTDNWQIKLKEDSLHLMLGSVSLTQGVGDGC